MTVEQAMWHINDVVAYDAMRELSSNVQALLLGRQRDGDPTAHVELLELRRTTLAVDGYDRAAVDAFAQQLRVRADDLTHAQ
ncbi:MAG TPA: hypothetical protein PK781_01545 [Terrimesophilobacter sp.]|nr:hypothetical protein [Terrimesophilobacter sp.]